MSYFALKFFDDVVSDNDFSASEEFEYAGVLLIFLVVSTLGARFLYRLIQQNEGLTSPGGLKDILLEAASNPERDNVTLFQVRRMVDSSIVLVEDDVQADQDQLDI